MGYADLDLCRQQLGLSDASAADAADVALLAHIDEAMSRVFDLEIVETARSPLYGGTATPEARRVPANRVAGESVLVLPVPAYAVTSVLLAGDGDETLTDDDVTPWYEYADGAFAGIERVDGRAWPCRTDRIAITVTAHWTDTSKGGAVPPEIVDALTFVVPDEYRLQKSSPTGDIGSDGLRIRPRNPWKYQRVRNVIDALRHHPPPVL